MVAVLQIKKSQHEARVPVTVFELIGEMDSSTHEQFHKEAQQAVEAGTRYAVLDFSKLSYISSAGLRDMVTLSKALAAKGGTSAEINANAGSFKSPFLKLFNPSPTVHQTLEMMGLTMSIEIYSDLSEALASF